MRRLVRAMFKKLLGVKPKPKQSKVDEREAERLAALEKEHALLVKANRKLRAQNMAERRMREAKRLLIEANVPVGILSPSDLVQFEPHQWATYIKLARRMVRVREGEKPSQ